MEDIEIERKFLWESSLPSKKPDRIVTRYLFPKESGQERRVQQTIQSDGSIIYRDQVKQELPNGDRKELKKVTITESEFLAIISLSKEISKIERHEYDLSNDDSRIKRITLVHYPTLHLSRFEVEFLDAELAHTYQPPNGMKEITGKLLRDGSLAKLSAEDVKQEITKIKTLSLG
jgi:hypothetical protein